MYAGLPTLEQNLNMFLIKDIKIFLKMNPIRTISVESLDKVSYFFDQHSYHKFDSNLSRIVKLFAFFCVTKKSIEMLNGFRILQKK